MKTPESSLSPLSILCYFICSDVSFAVDATREEQKTFKEDADRWQKKCMTFRTTWRPK